jgi:hypothetical protein
MAEDNAIENELATPEVSEVERKARNVGWVPKEEFRGDPARHVSAEEFLQRSDSLMPLLRRDNDKLHKKVSDLEGILKETRDAQREFVEFASKAEQRAYDKAKAEYQAQAEAAAANADQAGVRHAMQQMEALEKPFKPTPKPVEPAVNVDPTIQNWIAREDWYRNSQTLKGYAIDTFGEIERDHPGMAVEEMLAETKRRTMDKFPEKFGINPRRDAPATVSTPTGGNAPVRHNGRAYDNLPTDAKAACEKFMKTIPGFTREQYVASYDWDS